MTSSRQVTLAERASGGIRITAVIAIAMLSFLPIGAWLDTTFARAGTSLNAGWLTGTSAVGLLTFAVMIVLRRGNLAAWCSAALHRLASVWEHHPRWSTFAVATLAGFVYLITAWFVFDARPLTIDEVVQTLQARAFAGGGLWFPLDANPEFRSIMHMVEQEGRWYGQFPPGGPAMLALGELLNAPWIVNPVCGAVSVAAFATLLRWSGVRASVSLGATTAFAFAPFVVFQSASHMNHVTALMWLLISAAALVRATRDDGSRVHALVCGVGLGLAATIRPLDAATWALPAAAWLCWHAARRRAVGALLWSGVGVAVVFTALFWVNARTTGGPLTFGYTVLWGESHGLGFHTSPWGESHTVERGVALTAMYLSRLNEYLFELPIPSLAAPLAAVALTRRSSPLERYFFASGALLLGAYFAYWHDGFYPGPRFMFPLAPVAALLFARLPGLVAERWPAASVSRGVGAAYVSAVVLGLWLVLPPRIHVYARAFPTMRWDYDALADGAGASGTTVLVRESWGAQVVRRLWALGVSRSLTEVLYRNVDTCGLDDMAARLEQEGTRGPAAEERLRPMLADSARVVPTMLSPDLTERVLPNSAYPPRCFMRLAEDRAGYAHFEPTLLTRDTTTRWLRDLHALDTLVIQLDERRPLWLLRRDKVDAEGKPVFVRIDGDSLRAAWYGDRAPMPAAGPRR